MPHLYYDEVETQVGTLFVIGDGENIVRIDYGTYKDHDEKVDKWLSRYFPDTDLVKDTQKVATVRKQLEEYFLNKRKTFDFPIVFHGSPFQKKVWQVLVETIPYGKSKTYKDIANTIGNPKAVRAVGGAINKNPFSIVVPCHRVLGTNGKLVGYNGGLDKKEYLLKHEEILL